MARKITLCETSYRVRFYFLQRLQRFFETTTSCSLRFQRVTCLLQLTMDFFPTLQDKLQGKFHCVTLAVEFGFTSCNDCRDFLKLLQVAAQDSNVSHVSCNLQWIFFPTLQDKLQGKFHCVTLTYQKLIFANLKRKHVNVVSQQVYNKILKKIFKAIFQANDKMSKISIMKSHSFLPAQEYTAGVFPSRCKKI